LPWVGSGGKGGREGGEGEKTEGEGPFAGGLNPNWRCRYYLPPAPPPGIAPRTSTTLSMVTRHRRRRGVVSLPAFLPYRRSLKSTSPLGGYAPI